MGRVHRASRCRSGPHSSTIGGVALAYRFVTSSIVEYILNLERIHPDRLISVVVPELVERRWFYDFLHNQRAALLKIELYIKGNGHIVVTNVPWYLSA